jgi:hypothetical protein
MVVGYFEFCLRFRSLISWRIWTIRFLNSVANCPKSGLLSNAGKCFSRKANSSFSIGSRIIAIVSSYLSFRPPLLVCFPEGNQILYAPQTICDASGHCGGRAKCTMDFDEVVSEIV